MVLTAGLAPAIQSRTEDETIGLALCISICKGAKAALSPCKLFKKGYNNGHKGGKPKVNCTILLYNMQENL